MNKKYKVGEFVKNLGVSVGFLKHHEKYGTLTPHISPSGYRYYEFSQAMQAMQCLRLQNLGFTSKEISVLLTQSSDLDIRSLVLEKKAMIRKRLEFYQEVMDYLDQYTEIPHKQVEWSIYTPEPFYYLENVSNREFIEDPALQKIASAWTEYVPMTDVISKVQLQPSKESLLAEDPQIISWNMGLSIQKSSAEKLCVPYLDQTQLIQPGKCLVYSYAGNREIKKGHDYLKTMLQNALELCRKHHFDITGEIYEFNVFCSTIGENSYVREILYVPLKD